MHVADDSVPISELITAVKNAISEANISATDPGRDLRVTSLQLIVNAVASSKAGSGLDFRVPILGWKVKAAATQSRKKTHTIDITLVPGRDDCRFEVRSMPVEQMLVNAITIIRAAIAAAATGDDPFTLSASTVEIAFAVTDQGTISVGAEGELIDESTHILRLTFGT